MMTSAASLKWSSNRHGETSREPPSLVTQRQDSSVSQASDSAWRGLLRKERVLEQDIQRLLDLQATALVAGAAGTLGTGSAGGGDGRSEDRSTTPTDTFSFTASSGSRMAKSLWIPSQSTPEGNVIPVRQPTKPRRTGLQAVRNRLRESLADLADLKREEDAYAIAALSGRKKALARLDSLGTRRSGICDELKILEDDNEEPLGQELRKLESEHESLDDDIRQLHEKLAGMRSRRRWLKGRIDNVKSKREAGLSGYRGALKDVDAEVNALLRRPPVQPLDQEMIDRGKGSDEETRSVGGLEFLRLIPQRRTVEMARAWWEAEAESLEQQRAHIGEELLALEQGSILWQEVVDLVTHFESRLRDIIKAGADLSAPSFVLDGKRASSREDLIRSQLPMMGGVVTELAQRMQVAENKHWNLLICAIGAEWEAFKEAHDVLEGIVDAANGRVIGNAPDHVQGVSLAAGELGDDDPANHAKPDLDDVHAESDNEVPSDLIISRLDHPERELAEFQPDQAAAARTRKHSENDVPPEFLAEHDHGADL
ncbi:hypothetical protein G6O67_002340 [Ophiocordyceps sinensis]|uniref:Autophagy-related protein 28 n=1 Tax=Ophiocordyceps sinensis TaxID=72228 RepID=A0A8H4PU12_9HYPO|nr:hypothetical protein G6O67_002340 [Ophiocordyceps sinensis]